MANDLPTLLCKKCKEVRQNTDSPDLIAIALVLFG